MEKVMSEFKAGELKSGGDKEVTNKKQAIAIGLAIMFWPRTCTKVQSQGSTVMQENVYFRGVRGCPSTAEINNPAWYDTPLVDLKL